MPGLDQATLSRVAGNIRRAPASLLPGAADLIPSAEAVRRGYQEGPQLWLSRSDVISSLVCRLEQRRLLCSPRLQLHHWHLALAAVFF